MAAPRIVLMAGSARHGAYSVRLRDAARAALDAAGAHTEVVDLRALALPLYDADLEARDGVPAAARTLRDTLAAAHGLVFVTPEYNAFPTPLAINAWDWLSRVQASDGAPSGISAVAGKPVAVMASSPGALGGIRALPLMRQYLATNFQMLVVPPQFALGNAEQVFDDAGALKDARQAKTLAEIVQRLVRLASAGA